MPVKVSVESPEVPPITALLVPLPDVKSPATVCDFTCIESPTWKMPEVGPLLLPSTKIVVAGRAPVAVLLNVARVPPSTYVKPPV